MTFFDDGHCIKSSLGIGRISAGELRRRIERHLVGTSKIFPALGRWAMEGEWDGDYGKLASVIRSEDKRRVLFDNELVDEGGQWFPFNQQDFDPPVMATVRGGSVTEGLVNIVNLELPDDRRYDAEYLKEDLLKEYMKLVVKLWGPECIAASKTSMSLAISPTTDIRPTVGWWTYYTPESCPRYDKSVEGLPVEVFDVSDFAGGRLIRLTEKPIYPDREGVYPKLLVDQLKALTAFLFYE